MNNSFAAMTGDELLRLRQELSAAYEKFKSRGLKLDMSRGKPAPDQLDLSAELLHYDLSDYRTLSGIDARNYGGFDGIPEEIDEILL